MGRGGQKEPLYRKVNTLARGVRHPGGGDYRWERHTKAEKAAEADGVTRGKMRKSGRLGAFDYTPLFRFLLSKVGQDWPAVHAEAVSRLDREEPVFWMVARTQDERRRLFATGESSYFSGLFVDDANRLALVDPELSPAALRPGCACCTHTLNGVRFGLAYDPDTPSDLTPH